MSGEEPAVTQSSLTHGRPGPWGTHCALWTALVCGPRKDYGRDVPLGAAGEVSGECIPTLLTSCPSLSGDSGDSRSFCHLLCINPHVDGDFTEVPPISKLVVSVLET